MTCYTHCHVRTNLRHMPKVRFRPLVPAVWTYWVPSTSSTSFHHFLMCILPSKAIVSVNSADLPQQRAAAPFSLREYIGIMLILLLTNMPHVASDTSKSPHCHIISVQSSPWETPYVRNELWHLFVFYISAAELLYLEFSSTCGTQHSNNTGMQAFLPSQSSSSHKLKAPNVKSSHDVQETVPRTVMY